MDRADATPNEGIGHPVSASAPLRRRRGSISGGAPVGAGAPRALADARARVAAGLGADREAGAAQRAPGGARGVVPAPGSPRGGAAARRRRGARGAKLLPASDPRPAHALGELLHERGDELQLAAAAGAGRDPRLRRRARGGPPRRAGPLAPVLGAAR